MPEARATREARTGETGHGCRKTQHCSFCFEVVILPRRQQTMPTSYLAPSKV